MIAEFIGDLSWPTAAAISVFFTSIGFSILAFRLTRKSRREYDLEEDRIKLEHFRVSSAAQTARLLELKKIEKGLITSHREHDHRG